MGTQLRHAQRVVRPARVSRSKMIDAIIGSRLEGAQANVQTAALDGVRLSLSVSFEDGADVSGSDAEVAAEVLRQLAALFSAAAGGSPKQYELVG